MPDFRYRQTTVTLDVCSFAFLAAGRQAVELGSRRGFPDWQPDAEKGDEVQWLPTLCDGGIAEPLLSMFVVPSVCLSVCCCCDDLV